MKEPLESIYMCVCVKCLPSVRRHSRAHTSPSTTAHFDPSRTTSSSNSSRSWVCRQGASLTADAQSQLDALCPPPVGHRLSVPQHAIHRIAHAVSVHKLRFSAAWRAAGHLRSSDGFPPGRVEPGSVDTLHTTAAAAAIAGWSGWKILFLLINLLH